MTAVVKDIKESVKKVTDLAFTDSDSFKESLIVLIDNMEKRSKVILNFAMDPWDKDSKFYEEYACLQEELSWANWELENFYSKES